MFSKKRLESIDVQGPVLRFLRGKGQKEILVAHLDCWLQSSIVTRKVGR